MTALAHTAPGDAPTAPCRAAPDWQPRCIKLPAWPDGARLRPDSPQKVTKGYGAWPSFLQAHGWPDDRDGRKAECQPLAGVGAERT
jgi:hypothetical protein